MIGRVPRIGRTAPSSASSPSQAAVLRSVHDGRRHRQVEATPLFGQLGRREVDRYLAAWKFEAAIVDRDLDPLPGLLQRAVAQPHDMKPGEPIGNIGLDLDPDAVEAEDRPRQGPGQHQRRYYTVLCIGVSLISRPQTSNLYAAE
jgi:hypothetical protein